MAASAIERWLDAVRLVVEMGHAASSEQARCAAKSGQLQARCVLCATLLASWLAGEQESACGVCACISCWLHAPWEGGRGVSRVWC